MNEDEILRYQFIKNPDQLSFEAYADWLDDNGKDSSAWRQAHILLFGKSILITGTPPLKDNN